MTQHDLDQEERELLDAYEAGDFRSDMDADRRRQLIEAAKASTRKDTRMNIRIASRDLKALQRRAMEEGLPYQSLVASILHKYVSGGLKDVTHRKPHSRD